MHNFFNIFILIQSKILNQNISIYYRAFIFAPDGQTKGRKVVFTGKPKEMFKNGTTITAR